MVFCFIIELDFLGSGNDMCLMEVGERIGFFWVLFFWDLFVYSELFLWFVFCYIVNLVFGGDGGRFVILGYKFNLGMLVIYIIFCNII